MAFLGLADRDLVAKVRRVDPSDDYILEGLQRVVAQPKTSVQKRLVVLAGGVQVLHQPQQTGAVEIGQLGFDVAPTGRGSGGFLRCHANQSLARTIKHALMVAGRHSVANKRAMMSSSRIRRNVMVLPHTIQPDGSASLGVETPGHSA